MNLSHTLKQFYGDNNVISNGFIHHIYPNNDEHGFPQPFADLVDAKVRLDMFIQQNNMRLKNFDGTGANVYLDNQIIGTIIIHTM